MQPALPALQGLLSAGKAQPLVPSLPSFLARQAFSGLPLERSLAPRELADVQGGLAALLSERVQLLLVLLRLFLVDALLLVQDGRFRVLIAFLLWDLAWDLLTGRLKGGAETETWRFPKGVFVPARPNLAVPKRRD